MFETVCPFGVRCAYPSELPLLLMKHDLIRLWVFNTVLIP